MKKFTVLVILALLAAAGTTHATDRAVAPTMEPATIAPVFDRELAVKAGIDDSIDASVMLVSTAKPMMSEDIAWGAVGGVRSMITLNGTVRDMLLRPVAPCRLVDTRTDGGPFVAGETRRYLLPGGVRCTSAIPSRVTYPSADGVVVLVEVSLEADGYEFWWDDNGPTFDFVNQAYSSDWFTMNGNRAFLFATGEGDFPGTARGKIRGFVALKSFPGPFVTFWGLEARVSSEWGKKEFRAHVVIDVVGYAVPVPLPIPH